MQRAGAVILLIGMLLASGLAAIHAQDEEPVVTATVAAESANMRWMPEVYFQKLINWDSRIGELHAGDQLVVHLWEDVSYPDHAWVYATHAESNLTGWIRSDFLSFGAADWQTDLPVIRNWTEMTVFITETAPTGLQAYVTGGSGGYDHLNVRAEPYYGAMELGEIWAGSTVTILGRALSNGLPLPYVYVRDNVTGVEGWVVDSGLLTIGLRIEGRNPRCRRCMKSIRCEIQRVCPESASTISIYAMHLLQMRACVVGYGTEPNTTPSPGAAQARHGSKSPT